MKKILEDCYRRVTGIYKASNDNTPQIITGAE